MPNLSIATTTGERYDNAAIIIYDVFHSHYVTNGLWWALHVNVRLLPRVVCGVSNEFNGCYLINPINEAQMYLFGCGALLLFWDSKGRPDHAVSICGDPLDLENGLPWHIYLN